MNHHRRSDVLALAVSLLALADPARARAGKAFMPRLQAPMQELLAANLGLLHLSPTFLRHLKQFTTPRAFMYELPEEHPVRKLGTTGYQAQRLTSFSLSGNRPTLTSTVDVRRTSPKRSTWDVELTVSDNDLSDDNIFFWGKRLANGHTLELCWRTFERSRRPDQDAFTVRNAAGEVVSQGTFAELRTALRSRAKFEARAGELGLLDSTFTLLRKTFAGFR